MHKDKFVFAQLVCFLDRNKFNYIVRKYDGDKYVKHITCWNQLLAMMFDYAFDSTTTDLCLAVFWWAKFRKKKGGVKLHVLYDVETQIPAFFHITEASVHDSRAMKEIPYESGSYYIFDRAYNDFRMLYRILQIEAFFVARAKKNLQYKPIKWKRGLPGNVLSGMTIELTGFYPRQYYPGQIRLVRYWDEEQEREFVFLANATHICALQVADLYKDRWQVELFSNG